MLLAQGHDAILDCVSAAQAVGKLIGWKGQYGAVHFLRSDFWTRNDQLIRDDLSHRGWKPGSGDLHHKGKPKVHVSLVPEFLSLVDTSEGDPQIYKDGHTLRSARGGEWIFSLS